MKKLILLFALLPLKSYSFPQDTIILYTWGAELTGGIDYDQCEEEIYLTYKIKYEYAGGCIVSRGEVFRWKIHNFTKRTRLTFRYGINWERKIREEINNCAKEKGVNW